LNGSIDAPLVERFRRALGKRLGLSFDDGRLGDLLALFRARVGRADPLEYLVRFEAGSRDEVRALARELTVGETYFCRNQPQLEAFRAIVADLTFGTRLSVLSAGCASGEEPYSLSMVLKETLPPGSREPSVLGIDVNLAALERARLARYTSWSLRETPPATRARWFTQDARDFVLSDAIRTSVRLVEANLALDDAELFAPSAYDVIFCRNVIMYFTPEKCQEIVRRLTRALAPGGYLFLGHAETLRGLSHDFHLCHSHGAFYYRKKTREELAEGPGPLEIAAFSAHPFRAPPLAAPAGSSDGTGWIDDIERSAERVRELSETPATPNTASRPLGRNFEQPLDLLHREQYARALELVRSEPEQENDPERLLLESVLLAHSGKLADAEHTCRRLLALDELNGGAHYVLALCYAGTEKSELAIHHHRVAAYLAPDFSMPRLQLGLMLRRAGQVEAARRELSEARSLLEREDGSRLLLFGGGFGRAALLELCTAELHGLREAP
jgi:chemotaxis protein methyltransferase CheR